MRRFEFHRDVDVTGVSGTGVVVEGVEFSDGRAATHWLGEYPSTVAWDSVAHAQHVSGHGGATRLVWLDPVTDLLGTPLCGAIGPRICREQPEHVPCIRDRTCSLDPHHDGIHSWEPW